MKRKIILFFFLLVNAVIFAQEIEKSTPNKISSGEEIKKRQEEEIEKESKYTLERIDTLKKRTHQIEQGRTKGDSSKEKHTEGEKDFLIDLDLAISGVGRAREKSAVPYLTEILLWDPYPDNRVNAAQALGMISSTETIPALRKALEDEELAVQQSVAKILFNWGEREITLPVWEKIVQIKNLDDLDETLKGQSRADVYYYFIELPDKSEKQKRFAKERIQEIKEAMIIDAVRKLKGIGNPKVITIIREVALTHPNSNIRKEATKILNEKSQ
ncbi:MAG TPA: hypothetical protein DHV62_02480 [Elusimicrobia bacterium]|nr:hypothetical protein [Elusimicrobiota bacterium]